MRRSVRACSARCSIDFSHQLLSFCFVLRASPMTRTRVHLQPLQQYYRKCNFSFSPTFQHSTKERTMKTDVSFTVSANPVPYTIFRGGSVLTLRLIIARCLDKRSNAHTNKRSAKHTVRFFNASKNTLPKSCWRCWLRNDNVRKSMFLCALPTWLGQLFALITTSVQTRQESPWLCWGFWKHSVTLIAALIFFRIVTLCRCRKSSRKKN